MFNRNASNPAQSRRRQVTSASAAGGGKRPINVGRSSGPSSTSQSNGSVMDGSSMNDIGTPGTQIIIQPTTLEPENVVGVVESGDAGEYQPEFVLLNSIGGVSFDGGIEEASDVEGGMRSRGADVEGEGGISGRPVVYTDVADEGTLTPHVVAASLDELRAKTSSSVSYSFLLTELKTIYRNYSLRLCIFKFKHLLSIIFVSIIVLLSVTIPLTVQVL